MAPRNRRPPAAHPDAIDYGPALTRDARGNLVSWRGAALVDVDTRPDGDHPTREVVGARRRDGLIDLYTRGSLDRAQFAAFARFRDDLSRADGARAHDDDSGVRAAFSAASYGPGDAQLDASARVAGAWQAMGLIAAGVVSWVVVSAGSVRDYETCKRQRNGSGAAMLRAAADRLIAYYDRRPERASD